MQEGTGKRCSDIPLQWCCLHMGSETELYLCSFCFTANSGGLVGSRESEEARDACHLCHPVTQGERREKVDRLTCDTKPSCTEVGAAMLCLFTVLPVYSMYCYVICRPWLLVDSALLVSKRRAKPQTVR